MVVAGGAGRRFGGAKQFAELQGRTLVAWSVTAARSVAEGVVLVLPGPVDGGAPVAGDQAADLPMHGSDAVVAGGSTRSASVRAGLAAVPDTAAIVVVHDAARPLASAALFRRVVAAVSGPGGPAGAVPGLPVADTVKRVEGDRVVDTVPRHDLVAVQTPQAFRAGALRRAHAGGDSATDDAGLVESIGLPVVVVAGEPANLKVTTVADLAMAAALVPQ